MNSGELQNKSWFVLVLVQLLFFAAVWPYLSGKYVFAPSAYVAERALRADQIDPRDITPRDRYGAKDYLDQERIFLRFYRESLHNGNLPFWNERTFGGISQEDSMIYSYLSPLHLPWLVIQNDHVAKGIQIFLLLNLGAIAVLWWGNILGLGPGWTLLSIVLITLTPLALHFQGHTHQPALYYSGLMILAAYHQLLDTGRKKYLWAFFLLTCLATAFNFISILFFTCVALVALSVVSVIRCNQKRRAILIRIAIATLTFVLALSSFAFFIGPIILESHLVREPVAASFQNLAPWSSLPSFIDSLSYSRLVNGVWIPLFLTLPLLLFWRWRQEHSQPIPAVVLGLIAYLASVTLISGVEAIFSIFRTYSPGMKYSANATFRMLFFANICAVLALAWLFRNADRQNRYLSIAITLALFLIVSINATVFLISVVPESWALLHPKVYAFWTVVAVKGLRAPSGIATIIAVLITVALVTQRRLESARGVFLAFLIGVGFVTMYQYQRPNLRADLDPANHPIFQSLQRGSTVLTLENCASATRSWYRSEAALAGFRSLDGPTDVGLFPQVRNFWAHWNDVAEFNKRGANLMEVLWVCSNRALSQGGRMEPTFAALMRVLGVRYVITDRSINDPSMREAGSAGRLRAYENNNIWNEISFIPEYSASALESLLVSLSKGDAMALSEMERIERRRVGISGSKSGNLAWDLEIPVSVRGREGVLFMSHPNEYHRGITLPFVDLPLEGKWVLQDGRSEKEFPMRAIPFRLIDMAAESSHVQIRYSLVHYYFWLPLSLAAFAGFLGFQGIYFRKIAGRTAEGLAEA